MITITKSKDVFDPNKLNLINKCNKIFPNETFSIDDNDLLVNDVFIEVSFVKIKGSHNANGNNLMVIIPSDTDEAEYGYHEDDDMFIIRFDTLKRIKPANSFKEFIAENALVHFKYGDFLKWENENKIKINEPINSEA